MERSNFRGLAAIICAAAITLLSKTAPAQSYVHTGVAVRNDDVAAFGGISHLQLSKHSFLQGDVYSDQSANVGLVLRDVAKGYRDMGINAFSYFDDGVSGSVGFEGFTKDKQVFVNFYFGDSPSGADGGFAQDVFTSRNSLLKAVFGAYSLSEDSEHSSGFRVGLRASTRLGRKVDVFAEGDWFSNGDLIGDYTARVGISYPPKNKYRSVENFKN